MSFRLRPILTVFFFCPREGHRCASKGATAKQTRVYFRALFGFWLRARSKKKKKRGAREEGENRKTTTEATRTRLPLFAIHHRSRTVCLFCVLSDWDPAHFKRGIQKNEKKRRNALSVRASFFLRAKTNKQTPRARSLERSAVSLFFFSSVRRERAHTKNEIRKRSKRSLAYDVFGFRSFFMVQKGIG